MSASAISSLVDGANLQALLPPSLRAACRSSLVRRLTDEDEEYGPDYEVAGFALVRVIDEAELAAGRAIVAAAMQPGGEAVVARELTRLRFATASREFNTADMAMIARSTPRRWSSIPRTSSSKSVAIGRSGRSSGRRWPSWSSPQSGCSSSAGTWPRPWRAVRAKPPEPDPEEEQRREAIAAQERRYAEAAAFRDWRTRN